MNTYVKYHLAFPIHRAFSHYLKGVLKIRLPFYDAMENNDKRSYKHYFASHLYVHLGLYNEC